MKKLTTISIAAILALAGCSEPPLEPSPEVKNGPKLSAAQAAQFRSIIPGSRKSQMTGKDSG